jgi:hypothetical protein
LPAESKCSFSPASITGSGATTVTVTTMAPHAALRRASGSGALLWTTGLGVSLTGILLMGVPSRRRRWSSLLALVLFTCVLALPSCGGSNTSGGGGGGPTDPGTPVGNSVVTITATSGSLSHTTTFTLNVQ